ncbi:hypothetical protein K504DRAFT_529505 [Pleomassaria siparia CBS 279.74]|uniref:Uncharacterized protein n=1 Tax=Pleomassaria siparia CBS 279.74 TaxID=1314801 RepID=A0A6G1KR32_9PLEO|nr:hypothetical protein K504DRAFT_529505 [Pleomassaria siparia CBS 279.74]
MASQQYSVHIGFWTNWSHGKVQGATVTLTRQNGGFLIAFLAIFVGMVGKSFWRLGCFMLHRYFSSDLPEDGLYHQRQAILRNSDGAQDGGWRLIMSLLAWRSGRRAVRPIMRLLPIIIFSFTISAAFGIASIFSSRVTSETANEVLLKGTDCGLLDQDKPEDGSELLTTLQPFYAEGASRNLGYAQKCYVNQTGVDGCNLYIKPKLPIFADSNATCPFGDSICKNGTGNLVLDTGYLDSALDLGINAPKSQRFQVRFVHECAPIKTQGFMEKYNDSDSREIMRYKYGQVINARGVINFTYEVPIDNAFLPTESDGAMSANVPRLDYNLGIETHHSTSNESAMANRWLPIQPLLRDNADVHLLFLSAPGIHFATPVNDPWITATKPASNITNQDTKSSFSAYLQNEPLGVMACALSMQYCNPNLPGGQNCEPLRGTLDPRGSAAVKKIFTDEKQFSAVNWADQLWTGQLYTINDIVGFIGSSALLARYGNVYGYQGPLPDNQWQLEAAHWIKGTLASLQDVFVTSANGFPSTLADFKVTPEKNETVALDMCKNQKIVSTAFSSFNVLGMSLILVLGAWIIILDMGLEPTVAWWQRRRYKKHQLKDHFYASGSSKTPHPLYSVLEWSHTSTLQLQRLAHEEAGYATWSGCDGDTPVTLPGHYLAPLSLSDVKHPVLKRQEGSDKCDTDQLSREEWEDIMAAKPREIERTDTGLETLVEDMEEGKEGKRPDAEGGRFVFTTVIATEEQEEEEEAMPTPTGLGLSGHGDGNWRTLR